MLSAVQIALQGLGFKLSPITIAVQGLIVTSEITPSAPKISRSRRTRTLDKDDDLLLFIGAL